MKTLCEQGRYGLFVGGIPPFAFRSDRIDAVALDNQYGGVCAARVLRDSLGPRKRLAVFASRKGDIQNDLRVGGFLFREPHARVVDAGGWLTEHGRKAAPELLRLGTDGVFCCNDSLAAALLEHCRRHRLVPPRVVGFDDAPVAEEMNLTTIATPWKGMARLVAEITSRRLAGDTGPAACHILSVRPVFRLSH
jgi:DNA-binding LacI/PurR family transcriptional regulator